MTSNASSNDLKLVAVVGLCFSGKSEVIKFLVEYFQCPRVYFGGYVLRELDKRGLPHEEQHEKPIREGLRKEHGMAVMAKLALPDIQAHFSQHSLVLIDGLYSFAEYDLLKEEFGAAFKVLAVHTDRHIKHERAQQRPVRPLTPEGVDRRDDAEVRNLDKAPPIALADYHLTNNSSPESLINEVKKLSSHWANLANQDDK